MRRICLAVLVVLATTMAGAAAPSAGAAPGVGVVNSLHTVKPPIEPGR